MKSSSGERGDRGRQNIRTTRTRERQRQRETETETEKRREKSIKIAGTFCEEREVCRGVVRTKDQLSVLLGHSELLCLHKGDCDLLLYGPYGDVTGDVRCERVRHERDRDKDRQTETDRQTTDRQTDRQRKKEREMKKMDTCERAFKNFLVILSAGEKNTSRVI